MARGTIIIDQERCKGCELCAQVCPKGVIKMTESALNSRGYRPAALVDPNGECTGCAICAVICPDVCITVYREVRAQAHAAP
jgi:2-oxoglutarate ferredoxin oxidoreductase subunit delta